MAGFVLVRGRNLLIMAPRKQKTRYRGGNGGENLIGAGEGTLTPGLVLGKGAILGHSAKIFILVSLGELACIFNELSTSYYTLSKLSIVALNTMTPLIHRLQIFIDNVAIHLGGNDTGMP